MTLTFDLNIKIIFSPWIWVWQNVFALWHRHTKFWHMGVSPWENMLCTFLTLVLPWPLTYMRVAGGILSEFYSQFLSCLVLFLKILHVCLIVFYRTILPLLIMKRDLATSWNWTEWKWLHPRTGLISFRSLLYVWNNQSRLYQ